MERTMRYRLLMLATLIAAVPFLALGVMTRRQP
jgi:hypothetical protein